MVTEYEPRDENTLFLWVDQLRAFRRGDAGAITPDEADEKARELIEDFCLRHWLDKPQSRYTMSWLVDALGEVLEHEPAHIAFSLKARKKGRQTGTGQDLTPVAAWCELAIRRGYTVEEAAFEASELFGCSTRTVERARADIEFYPDVDLADYLSSMKRPRPLPADRSRGRAKK